MSDNPESQPDAPKPTSKEEIEREVLEHIAEAIRSASKSPARPPQDKASAGQDGKAKDGDKKKDDGAEKKGFQWTPPKVVLTIVIGLIALAVAAYYILYSATHESTDDAYTTGYVHQISSRVTGNVQELLITDNEFVHQGQVLIKLDPTDYQVQLDKAQANYDRAKADFDRVDALKDDVAISKQDYDQTKTNMEVAKANLEDANDQLGYCTIVAPTDGYIGNRTVNIGDRVSVGGALMTVVQDVWVVANFKETQIGKMKKNQSVKIVVDAIPSHTFTGHVDSFSPGTGATFALLPPDNATGNFTKIVQRVPVKIYFDSDSLKDYRSRLVPGLSVEAYVSLDDSVQPTEDQMNKAGQ
jgi:membrane fusion protein (multidrug efflux system)